MPGGLEEDPEAGMAGAEGVRVVTGLDHVGPGGSVRTRVDLSSMESLRRCLS